jgi:hypothetical protein
MGVVMVVAQTIRRRVEGIKRLPAGAAPFHPLTCDICRHLSVPSERRRNSFQKGGVKINADWQGQMVQ